MRIGELAERSGASVRALRYYEEQGLLHSLRTSGGQRRYDDGAVERVRMLQALYDAGLSSRTIAALLPCVDTPSDETNDDAYARLIRERDRIDTHIAELTRARTSLDAVISVNRDARARA